MEQISYEIAILENDNKSLKNRVCQLERELQLVQEMLARIMGSTD